MATDELRRNFETSVDFRKVGARLLFVARFGHATFAVIEFPRTKHVRFFWRESLARASG